MLDNREPIHFSRVFTYIPFYYLFFFVIFQSYIYLVYSISINH